MLARTLPAVLFGPIAGTLVDRLDRKRPITADICRGLMYAAMVFVSQLWAIYVLSFAIECLSPSGGRPVTRRSRTSCRGASSPTRTRSPLSRRTAPSLGGIVFTVLVGLNTLLSHAIPFLEGHDQAVPLFLDAATFVFSAAMIAASLSPVAGDAHGAVGLHGSGEDIRDGIRFLREDSMASAMTAGIVVAFSAVGAVLALAPIFVVETLGADDAGWGFIVTSFGVGIGLGMASANQTALGRSSVSIFPWSLVAAATTLFVLASMPNSELAAVVTVWLGAFCGPAGSPATRCSRRTSRTSSEVGRSPPSPSSPGWGCSCPSPRSLRWRVSMGPSRRGARDPLRPRDRGGRGRWPASTPGVSSSGTACPVPNPSRSCRS